ncbi:unnamed protein product [Brassica oleracea]
MEPEIVYTTLTPNKGTTPVAMQNGNVLDNNNVDNNNKGKAIQLGSFSDDEQEENESSPGSSPLSSNSLLDPDSLIYEDDSDQYGYEMDMEEDQEADDYVSEYQALFDAKEKELPAGVEATNKPWNALPHNSKGIIPNSAYALPQNLLEPQPPVPAPASSSSVLLPTQNKKKEMIFVRAYESRMDLLRAVIIGADGTPYHDGLFFFDIFFPDTYPSVPPVVHYHSGGLGINPNLYGCGKVCLSLLGTWSGSSKEKWLPNKSTMLQVLVSIQGLILNEKPYFNEPGLARTSGSPSGESRSKAYSESIFLLSLKIWFTTRGDHPNCAHDVLKACDAYRDGAPVASLVRGKVKEGGESNEKCSEKFRTDVATFVDTILLKEFILLGVLGLEPGEEDKPSETKVAESSSSSRRKRGRVSLK